MLLHYDEIVPIWNSVGIDSPAESRLCFTAAHSEGETHGADKSIVCPSLKGPNSTREDGDIKELMMSYLQVDLYRHS